MNEVLENVEVMRMAKIQDILKVKTGKYDANHATQDGEFKFFTCALEPFWADTFSFDDEVIILPGNGANVGEVLYYNGKLEAYQRTYVLHEINANAKYLYYYFKKYWVRQITKKQVGSATNYIKMDDIMSFEIPLPNLVTQQKIASILDKADELRQYNQQLIEKYDALTQSLFLEMFGDPVKNILKFPILELIALVKDKNDIKCGPFGTQLSKSEYVEFGVPIWGIPQVNSLFAKKPTEYITEQKAAVLKQYSVLPGDIVMSRKGNVGKCALYPSNWEMGILHSDALRIRCNEDKILPMFLNWQFKLSRSLKTQVNDVSSGAIMAGINVGKLKNIKAIVPPMSLQNQFAERVQLIEQQKQQVQQTLEKSEELFQSLLQKAFKGELT